MLDIVYYPVSGILWFWHKIFGFVLGPSSGIAWALSVVFLVFSLRLLLYKPFVKQIKTTRQMQQLQPHLQALKKKYGKDRQRMALEMQKLQKEHGFNPLMGCLPMLVQIPVFLGLYHVLRSFNRTGHGFGQLGLDAETNANTPNYLFGIKEVQSFLDARLFGAPISAAVNTPASQLEAFRDFGGIPDIWTVFSSEGATLTVLPSVLWVGLPLMVIAGIATHFNMRASVQRQTPEMAAQPQTKIMNKLGLYIFPFGVVVFGWLLPIAVLLYWVANNVWTYGQQHLVFGRIDREEEAARQAVIEKRAQNAPKPGAKPSAKSQKQKAAAEAIVAAVDESMDEAAVELSDPSGNGTAATAKAGDRPKRGAPNQHPRPRKGGNRPKSQKRARR